MIAVAHFRDKATGVFGLGRSGIMAARALGLGGARVIAWDDGAPARAEAEKVGVPLGKPAAWPWDEMAALVLSPGVPLTHPAPHPVVARARAANCPVMGDIELLALSRPEAAFIGITGTNGKSTTTALIGHLLNHAGRRVEVGGNLGIPALALEPLSGGEIYVLELSSYQLDLVERAVFDIAVLLNLSADHLDRHGDMDGYVAAKWRIFRGGDEGHAAIVGIDDPRSRALFENLCQEGRRRVIPISAQGRADGGVFVENGILMDDMDGAAHPVLDLAEAPRLPGAHNWQNAAAAFAVARAAGVASETIAEALCGFPGLAHRQEVVGVVEGVSFVNDSKATNADATVRALGCYGDIYWIAGGRPKAGGLSGVEPALENVRHAFLIGEAADDFAAFLKGRVSVTSCGDLATATAEAHRMALSDGRPGAVVLLSPACASFDQFANFEARGEAFRDIVGRLSGCRGAAS